MENQRNITQIKQSKLGHDEIGIKKEILVR